jgi:hypothetical protein
VVLKRKLWRLPEIDSTAPSAMAHTISERRQRVDLHVDVNVRNRFGLFG